VHIPKTASAALSVETPKMCETFRKRRHTVRLVRQSIGVVALKVGYNKQTRQEEDHNGQREKKLAMHLGYTWFPAFLRGNSKAVHPGGRLTRGLDVADGQVTGPRASLVHKKDKGIEKPEEKGEVFPSPE
jgi:hypothetical protein